MSKKTKSNYLQVGVELYGGGIWHSWFDRDLSLAGRVIVANREAHHSEDPKFVSKLVKIDRPILRIPTLAIHLDRTANDNFKFNKETEFQPILGLVEDALNATDAGLGMKRSHSGTPHQPLAKNDSHEAEKSDDLFNVANMEDKHHPKLLSVLADELGCDIADIQDFELYVYCLPFPLVRYTSNCC